jgi:hypothetical protein
MTPSRAHLRLNLLIALSNDSFSPTLTVDICFFTPLSRRRDFFSLAAKPARRREYFTAKQRHYFTIKQRAVSTTNLRQKFKA